MDFNKKDISELFNISERTVERLVDEDKVPFYTINGEVYFSREEIEEWIYASKEFVSVSGEPGISQWRLYSLYRAIHKGLVIRDSGSKTKEEVITNTISKIAEKVDIDPQVVCELFLAREEVMPTGLTKGVAAPHSRDFYMKGISDIVVFVFFDEAIEWGSLDNERVHTACFLLACDDKRHLNLLAKIAHLTNAEESQKLLRSKPNKDDLLNYIKRWEPSVGRSPLSV